MTAASETGAKQGISARRTEATLGRQTDDGAPFRLVRWFAGLGLICVLVTAVGTAMGLERFLARHMMRHDAELSAEFIDSLVRAERTWSYFSDPQSTAAREPLESFFSHVANLPGVVRSNVFAPDGTVLWSSTAELIGQRFPRNDELSRALGGEIVVESGTAVDTAKPEHMNLGASTGPQRFVEAYLPIRGADRLSVIGVVEIYRIPQSLFRELDAGVRQVWISTGLSAAVIYSALLWIAMRTSITMRRQQERLVENETLAAIGSVASAVAHGLRNPLASIRSSAELATGESGERLEECLADIQREADRMDGWVRDLLMQARGDQVAPGAVDVNAVLEESLRSFTARAERQAVTLRFAPAPGLPPVHANPGPLAQALENLIANALEAMPESGTLTVTTSAGSTGATVLVRVADSGPGIPERMLRVGTPVFASTKPHGTGLGLALARRILGSYGGQLQFERPRGGGTVATVTLHRADRGSHG